VTGRITQPSISGVPTLEPLTGKHAAKLARAQRLQAAPLPGRILGVRPPVALPHSTLIGDLKLTALKTRLASVGVHAELVGEGMLICGRRSAGEAGLEDSVAVRKTGRGKVELEGAVTDTYYVVRKEIYGKHRRSI
jgi:cleavage and polyadenylation specificity factor subunit 2